MPPKRKASTQRTKRAKKPVVERAPECAPLGDNPFGGHFDHSMPGETPEDECPSGMMDDWAERASHSVDVLGDLSVTLDIAFHDGASARAPISDNLLNERIEPGAAIRSIGWNPPMVHDGDDEHDSMRDYEEADGALLVATKCKYIVVAPRRSEGAKGRIYRRNDGVWLVRDILCAVLDTERHVRSQTEWFGGIDAHHVFLDYVFYNNGVVSYGFGS